MTEPPGSPATTRRWGLGDAVAAYLVGTLASVLFAGLVVGVGGYEADLDDAPFWLYALVQVPFWAVLVAAVVYAGSRKGNGVVADFGLTMRRSDVWRGTSIGVLTQLVAVPLLYVPIFWAIGEQDVSEEARKLTERIDGSVDALALIVTVVVIAPVVEELFFRGLLLRSLERRAGMGWAVIISSIAFGAVHLQVLQFPALVMFGLVAAMLVRASGRLGPALWAHVGFNAVTVVVLLAIEDRYELRVLVETVERIASRGGG